MAATASQEVPGADASGAESESGELVMGVFLRGERKEPLNQNINQEIVTAAAALTLCTAHVHVAGMLGSLRRV
jgi:hypothetical protein